MINTLPHALAKLKAPSSAKSGPEVDAILARHAEELQVLRETINQLLFMAKSQSEEKERSDAFAVLIMQLREANQNLVLATVGAQDSQATAEASSDRQTEFLAMLAHELRNPLQPIAMANTLLESHLHLHADIVQAHAVIARQVAHMARLVDDLLDASRIHSGNITLKKRPILLQEILDSAVEAGMPGFNKRHQHLSTNFPARALVVDADQVRLSQALSNLLVNASKFTPEFGNIRLDAQVVPAGVAISVSDDGAGVATEIQDQIFELFTQGFRSSDRAQGGLGIGLALVRSIAELHGGVLTMFSAGSGCGSRFTITLPLSLVGTPDNVVAAVRPASSPSRHILLVEDNPDANETLALLLEQQGHRVARCYDGASALRMAGERRYDVIMCDIGLPEMDGHQLLATLRMRLAPVPPCFIAISGYSPQSNANADRPEGFDHYLVKPISAVELNTIIAAQAVGGRA